MLGTLTPITFASRFSSHTEKQYAMTKLEQHEKKNNHKEEIQKRTKDRKRQTKQVLFVAKGTEYG